MLRFQVGLEWRKSAPHLLLLSKFLHPRTIDDFAASDLWATALRESPRQAIKRFLDERILVRADLSAQLDYKFKVTELKYMLKVRALSVSGRKGDLIQRLVEANPKGMKQAVAELTVVLCSESGREIAERYLASENAKRSEVEQETIVFLRQQKFKEASMAVASYEAAQVFPRGIGIDWRHHNSARDVEMLKAIFGGKPQILAQLNDSQLDALRLAAGMICLWGTNQGKRWLPPNFETGLIMDSDAAARMFFFHASHQVNVANYRQSGVVRQVKILTVQDSCDACKKISGKRFRLTEVLELPYKHCTHEMGCRCTLLPITE